MPDTPETPAQLIWEIDDLVADKTLTVPEGILGGHMLLPGTLAVLAGPNGAGKTWVGIKLAECISTGKLFGSLPTKESRVLFISEEMTPAEMRSRLQVFNRPVKHRGWRFRFQQGLKLNWGSGINQLMRIMDQEARPELLIIDAFRDVHTGPENVNDYMAPLLKDIRDRIARMFDCCVMLIHHFGKPSDVNGGINSVRGAKVITDVASDVLLVDRTDFARTIQFAKVRHGIEPNPMLFSISEAEPGKIDVVFQ
jgi:RecA-family ATPase